MANKTRGWSKCARCRRLGYYSLKFDAVLCDPHFFELNGKQNDKRSEVNLDRVGSTRGSSVHGSQDIGAETFGAADPDHRVGAQSVDEVGLLYPTD